MPDILVLSGACLSDLQICSVIEQKAMGCKENKQKGGGILKRCKENKEKGGGILKRYSAESSLQLFLTHSSILSWEIPRAEKPGRL